jgi:hypothetical protein
MTAADPSAADGNNNNNNSIRYRCLHIVEEIYRLVAGSPVLSVVELEGE